MITLTFPGQPISKQSVRFAKIGNHVRAYQKKRDVDKQNNLSYAAQMQLPENFKLFEGPLAYKVVFYFYPPKRLHKTMQKNPGQNFWVDVKPDLIDNLNKSLFDSLNKIVYNDDKQFVWCLGALKLYSFQPRTELSIYTVDFAETYFKLNI